MEEEMMMKKESKKLCVTLKKVMGRIIMALMIICGIGMMETDNVHAKEKTYSSYKEVLRDYVKDNVMANYCHYAYKKVRTKSGTQKALFVARGGCTKDATTTEVFIKKGKKVIPLKIVNKKGDTVSGCIESVSKNGKYMMIEAGRSTGFFVCKYKNGKYVVFKEYWISGSEAYKKRDSVKEQWIKKYKMVDDIDWKIKEKKNKNY